MSRIETAAGETLPVVTAAFETLPVAEVVTDADLIAAAKDLNASVQFHLRKSAEQFWKLGEALTNLQQRPSVKGRWREVLEEIGVNRTSANQAQRLYAPPPWTPWPSTRTRPPLSVPSASLRSRSRRRDGRPPTGPRSRPRSPPEGR